jgi:DNA-binding transcriptional LysR family regulator
MRLVEGSCDLLIAYHHPSQPYQLDADRYEMVSLGEESVAPYVKPDALGLPMFQLPGKLGHALPYLAYAPGAYLGHMVELILKQSGSAIHFDRVYETDMAEGLKAMALEGHGVAFLPFSAVKKDLRAKKLVSAAPANTKDMHITMEVRAYRERPSNKEPGKSGVHTNRSGGPAPKRNAEALWEYLVAQAAAK